MIVDRTADTDWCPLRRRAPRPPGWSRALLRAAALVGLLAPLHTTASARAQEAKSSPEPSRNAIERTVEEALSDTQSQVPDQAPATLVYWNRPIVTFRARIGTQGPKERVEAALRRLESMSETALRGAVSSRIGAFEGVDVALVSVEDQLAFGLLASDQDPLAETTLAAATGQAVRNLSLALEARLSQRRLPVLLRGLGESIAASLVVAFLIFLIRRLRRWWVRVTTVRQGRFEKVHLLGVDLGDSVRMLLRRLINFSLWTIDAVLVWLWLTFVLSRFPYTEPWSDALGGWLVSTVKSFVLTIAHAAPNLATIALIFVAARAFVGLVSGILKRVEAGTLELTWLSPQVARGARRLVVLAIWLFTLAIAYPFIPGSSSGAFQGVSVFAGLLFTVASAGLINQVMAGWVILFSGALKVGDFVRVGSVEGRVTQVGVLATKIVDALGQEVVLPNAVVTGTTTVNFSRYAAAAGSVASTSVTIGYDAPWRQIHAMLLAAAASTSGVRREPQPFVRQRALSDFYVEYDLVVEVETDGRANILSRLHGNIQDEFNRHGVQIMSPHFRAQPDAAVVVPETKWYVPPASRAGE
jgi:small-conductance mechanosensitive channel